MIVFREERMQDKLDVLLVDDEKIVGNRLRPTLKKAGCEVEVFENPKMALDRIGEKEFDIIVTDIVMEGVNGIQILEEAQKRSDRTRVIVITGYATVTLAREAMDKGAFDIIEKPFRPNDLRAVIASAAKALGFQGDISKKA
jgi:DNA-binding NtrC family response regulator